MTKQIEVTWIETLTQIAVFDVPDDLDVDADLDQFPDQLGEVYDQVICVAGGPVGPMFPVRDAAVSERTIDHWRIVGVEPDLQPGDVGLTRAERAYLRKLGVSWGDLHENARADFQAGWRQAEAGAVFADACEAFRAETRHDLDHDLRREDFTAGFSSRREGQED